MPPATEPTMILTTDGGSCAGAGPATDTAIANAESALPIVAQIEHEYPPGA